MRLAGYEVFRFGVHEFVDFGSDSPSHSSLSY
jgi:hypothetical protein